MNNTYDGLNNIETQLFKSFTSMTTDPNIPYTYEPWDDD